MFWWKLSLVSEALWTWCSCPPRSFHVISKVTCIPTLSWNNHSAFISFMPPVCSVALLFLSSARWAPNAVRCSGPIVSHSVEECLVWLAAAKPVTIEGTLIQLGAGLFRTLPALKASSADTQPWLYFSSSATFPCVISSTRDKVIVTKWYAETGGLRRRLSKLAITCGLCNQQQLSLSFWTRLGSALSFSSWGVILNGRMRWVDARWHNDNNFPHLTPQHLPAWCK